MKKWENDSGNNGEYIDGLCDAREDLLCESASGNQVDDLPLGLSHLSDKTIT